MPLAKPLEPSALRIMVTGASGFVGAHLALTLSKLGCTVFAVGGKQPCAEEVQKQCACINADLATDSARVIEWSRPNVIVHAAALANAAVCQADPDLARRSNVEVTESLISLSKRLPESPLFIQISTDLVFDGAEAPGGGFLETDEPKAISVYAVTKREAERTALEYGRSIVARICLVYGNRVGAKQGFMGWILDSVRNGKTVKLFVDEFRTPVFAEDAALAVYAIIAKQSGSKTLGTERIVHIAGPETLSRYDFGIELSKSHGFDPELLHPARQADEPVTPPRPKDVSLNISRLKERYGFTPRNVAQCLLQMKLPDSLAQTSYER